MSINHSLPKKSSQFFGLLLDIVQGNEISEDDFCGTTGCHKSKMGYVRDANGKWVRED